MKVEAKSIVLKNGTSLILRSPLPGEAAAMLEHLRITHRESYRNLNQPPAFYEALSVEEEEQILRRCEESPSQSMIAVFLEQRVVGSLGLFGSTGKFQKFNARIGMSVQLAYAGQGLGFALMQRAFEVAVAMGMHRLDLTVRVTNQAGVALYEKCGFERVGRLKEVAKIEGHFVDEFYYQRLL